MKFTPAQREIKRRAIATLVNAGWAVVDATAAVGYARGTSGTFGISPAARDMGRNQRMADMYRQGQTLEEIGLHFDLTRERVRQLLKKAGLSRQCGGAFIRKGNKDIASREEARDRREARALSVLGVDWDTAVKLNGSARFYAAGTRASTYLMQKRSAGSRDIPWAMNFGDWCRVWDESGKWSQRGRNKGNYVMARRRDMGPYSVDNVRVITVEQNIAEGWDVNPYHHRVPPNESLRAMQRRVYELRQEGKGHAEIGAELGITAHTSLQYCVVGKRLAAREAA